ncbi:uncharacterized protein LOC124259893 isoform X2 [Haliotis rubra]|uniref:uncharacterized protein LOC124259893 isoform X2 n=1 Tax=Haliotis rubra TaxID=36100 RepID=UPI001EE5A8B5|nr:uncharacterized protein LOC124259893 isoform X2 [Haliotis rubra]
MEGELEFGGKKSDSGESDDSSVPSRYSSEGDVPLLADDVFSDSDDPVIGAQTSGDTLQSGTVSSSEQRRIVGILSAESEQSFFDIFPSIVEDALMKQHAHIVQRLRELPKRNRTVVISGGSLLKMIDPSWEGRVPASVLCDACVFSPTRPVMVLTFTTGDEDSHKNIQYNTQLAMVIIQYVKVDTKFDFNIIHDTVDASLCKERQDFLTKIEQCENSAKCICFPAELHMDEKKCTTIIETFLKYLSDGTESARLSPSTEDRVHVNTISEQDSGDPLDELRQQLRAMDEDHQQVISEVNQHHEEKVSKLMYLHAQRKQKLEKEIEELIQKLRHEKKDETSELHQLNLFARTSSKMDDFPKCSVCQQQFTLKRPAPYLLPCLHAVCETCVTSAAGGVISCSTCQREVNLTDTCLQKDAVRQKEIFHLTVKHRPTELFCANNDGNQAVCWCRDCQELLCEYCQNMHSSLNVFRNHVLQNFSDMVPTVSDIPTSCSIHKYNVLDLFDKSCQKVICARCKIHDHADHNVEELDVVADAVTKQFHHQKNELLKLQTRQKTHMQSIREEIKSTDRTHDTLKRNIGHTFQTLRLLLDQRESELTTDLEIHTKETKATQQALLTTTEEDWETCTDVSDYIDKVLLYAPKLHILELESRVGDRARSCLKDVRSQSRAVTTVFVNTNRLSGLKSAISVLGTITTDDGNVESFRDKDTQTLDDFMADLERKHKIEITELKMKQDSDEKRIESFRLLTDKLNEDISNLKSLIAEKENIERRLSKNPDVLLGVARESGIHLLNPGTVDRSVVLKCTPLKYDKDRVNLDKVHINTEGDLVNRKSVTRPAGEGRLKKYWGTCGTDPLPQDGCPQYWEVENRVSLDKPLSGYNLILEVGVCREEQRDVDYCIGGRPYSYSMTVSLCTPHGGICRRICKEGKYVLHLPGTLPNTAGASHTLHYGVVYDDARKKIVFIDVKEKKVVSTLDNVDCSEPLWPMFGVYNPEWITDSMRLVVGSDINMTEEKKVMIVKALA